MISRLSHAPSAFSGCSVSCPRAALASLVLSAGLAIPAFAQQDSPSTHAGAPQSTTLTIYSKAEPGAVPPELYQPGLRLGWWQPQPVPGYGVVREVRNFALNSANGELKVTDVAAMIDPTTVTFESLTSPATRVLEQNFQFDLINRDAMLKKYVDKPVQVALRVGDRMETVQGTLLSADGGLTIRDEKGAVQILNEYAGIRLVPQDEGGASAEGGLITKPTLVWNLTTDKPGPHSARLSYETKGMTWWADYSLLFKPDSADANKGLLDLSAWVSILNQSGAGYPNATLKLIAGEVNRATPNQNVRYELYSRAGGSMAEAAPQFEEKSFFEYHLYTLSRPTTLPSNSTKQLELFPAVRDIPCEKVIVYDGQGTQRFWGSVNTDQGFGATSFPDVNVYLRFKNDEASKLGMPLPAGRIRVNQLDAASPEQTEQRRGRVEAQPGTPEFIGEDIVRHTPRNESVLIKVGKAFDVVGERRQTAFTIDTDRRIMRETIEVKVRNRKKEAVRVIVQERLLRWTGWEFLGVVPAHTKEDSTTVHFPLTLNPDQEGIVTYTVQYNW